MIYDVVISVDPGASGAAVIRNKGGKVCRVEAFQDDSTIVDTVVGWGSTPVAAVIERVWASPVMGVSSSFAFGDNFGAWRLGFKTSGIPVFGVTPQAWQKVVVPHVRGQGEARKAALKEEALARFDIPVGAPALPQGVRVTLKNCDALLLSEYADRQNAAGLSLGVPL